MYLITPDLKRLIQLDNLNQIIGSDTTILSAAISTAIEELRSYLVQKYDLTTELQDTPVWVRSRSYAAGNRVYITADDFNAASIYSANDLVVYQGYVYSSIAGSIAHAFNASEWNKLGLSNQIFFAQYPRSLFNVYGSYKPGDQVYWNGRVYTCVIASSFPVFPPDIQIGHYELQPNPNVFPDNPVNGIQYWGAGVAYTVPADTAITNTTLWTAGDNRSQQLVTYGIDIALYHAHTRIAPRNIPDLRVKRYDDAKKELKRMATGETTASLPVLQPRQGGRIRWGGNIKNENSY